MKINRYGVVILSEGPARVENWRVERDDTDPAGVATEELLLAFAIQWAKERFDTALKIHTTDLLRNWAKGKLEEKRQLERQTAEKAALDAKNALSN